LIYAAAASLWAYLFTAPLVEYRPGLGWLTFAVPAVVILCWLGLHWIEDAREEKLRMAVKCLMKQLLEPNDAKLDDSQSNLVKTIKAWPILGMGKAKDKNQNKNKDKDTDIVERRVAYHWDGYEQKRDPRARAASALLSAVIDLPARWIEDVWSCRR